ASPSARARSTRCEEVFARRKNLDNRPGDELAAGELDGADAEREYFASVKRQIRRARKFEPALKIGKIMSVQHDVGDLPNRNSPRRSNLLVQARARIRQMQFGSGSVGK